MGLSACRNSNRIIDLQDFKKAIAFIEELEPEMSMSFGVQDYRRTADLAKQIIDMVPLAGEISKANLINALYKSGIAGNINDLNFTITTLVEGRLLMQRPDGNKIYLRRPA